MAYINLIVEKMIMMLKSKQHVFVHTLHVAQYNICASAVVTIESFISPINWSLVGGKDLNYNVDCYCYCYAAL